VYLKQYPKGKFAALAKLEMKKLDDGEKAQAVREEAERKLAAEREESEYWKRASTAKDSATLQDYLDRYPAGAHVAEAQIKLAKTVEENAVNVRMEQDYWQPAESAENVDDISSVQRYLDKYPNGKHSEVAKQKLANLRSASTLIGTWGRTYSSRAADYYDVANSITWTFFGNGKVTSSALSKTDVGLVSGLITGLFGEKYEGRCEGAYVYKVSSNTITLTQQNTDSCLWKGTRTFNWFVSGSQLTLDNQIYTRK
jgi:translation elongation factor P/translation initiation factor 5A